jgi:hypothetical protein
VSDINVVQKAALMNIYVHQCLDNKSDKLFDKKSHLKESAKCTTENPSTGHQTYIYNGMR